MSTTTPIPKFAVIEETEEFVRAKKFFSEKKDAEKFLAEIHAKEKESSCRVAAVAEVDFYSIVKSELEDFFLAIELRLREEGCFAGEENPIFTPSDEDDEKIAGDITDFLRKNIEQKNALLHLIPTP